MKKLLAAVIMSVVVIGTAQAAKPTVEDAISVQKFCGQMGKDVSNMYILKERGFDKEYVVEVLIANGGSESYAQFLADATYELRTGMVPTYVQVGMSKACVKAMTKEAVK